MIAYNSKTVFIKGKIRLKAGSWIDLNYETPLSSMKEHAFRVGYHLAAGRFRSLNNHSIQDLETWNDADEVASQTISKNIIGKNVDEIAQMGDDAQLFAGAMLALSAEPNREYYKAINDTLSAALEQSFWNDDIWGNKLWHPMANQQLEKSIPKEIITEVPTTY
jgi:hypothetical protein